MIPFDGPPAGDGAPAADLLRGIELPGGGAPAAAGRWHSGARRQQEQRTARTGEGWIDSDPIHSKGDGVRDILGTSSAQKREKISEIHEIEKKNPKSCVSKEFACLISYFEKLANLMSKEVSLANLMLNIEIPRLPYTCRGSMLYQTE